MKASSVYTLAGVIGGIALSRLAPPVLASVRGAAGSALGEDPFKKLISQHRRLLALLDRMLQQPATPARRAMLLLTFKRTIAKHAMAEEDVVYPLLFSIQDRAEAAEKLYREHAGMKIHLFALEQALKDTDEWTLHVRALREEIAKHARQEEEEEFPRLREMNRPNFLNSGIRREEALVL